MSNGKGSTDHRYRGRAEVMIRALHPDEAGWLMQREEVRQRLGEDGALEFERETLRRQGICPNCFNPYITPMGNQDVDWPRLLNAHRCEPKEPA